eukprot:scpid106991/ scgid6276/ 
MSNTPQAGQYSVAAVFFIIEQTNGSHTLLRTQTSQSRQTGDQCDHMRRCAGQHSAAALYSIIDQTNIPHTPLCSYTSQSRSTGDEFNRIRRAKFNPALHESPGPVLNMPMVGVRGVAMSTWPCPISRFTTARLAPVHISIAI